MKLEELKNVANAEAVLTESSNLNDAEYYQATGEDEEGNKYLITWKVLDDWIDEDVEPDESEACDWDNPVSIEMI